MSERLKQGGISNEQEVYDSAPVDARSGELLVWDDVLFPAVVRRRQNALVNDIIRTALPKDALDVGCGGGWLTHHMSGTIRRVIGIDVSRKLLLNAKSINSANNSFVIGDGGNLPIADKTFDLIVSVATLHHLDAARALREWKRVSRREGYLILIEPNALNPFAEVGRKLFPLETHTLGEKPLRPAQLKRLLEDGGWELDQMQTEVFFSFVLSRLLRVTGREMRPDASAIHILEHLELALENVPLLNKFGWVITSVARNVGK